MTSRDLVRNTLEFAQPSRVPRQMWSLPWAENTYPDHVAKIRRDFRDDIISAPNILTTPLKTSGDAYEVGEFTDEWGCVFVSISRGYIGEIKDPVLTGDEWEGRDAVRFPEERINLDKEAVNAFCREADEFVIAAACPRPFERLQFLRGTEQLYVDIALQSDGLYRFLKKLHSHNLRWQEIWAETDVDALMMMDDWGAQSSLLIDPGVWRSTFKPLYREYIDIAHAHGKKAFMHSDGYIVDIIPDLIEIGLDALNSQIFCMGVENLEQYAGKLTFWGEIDRQHLLPNGTTEEIYAAVDQVKGSLWRDGGCIAQCEFGPGARPENVYAVFKAWDA